MKESIEVLVLEKYVIKFYDESDFSFESSDNLFLYNNIYLNGDKDILTSIVGIKLFEENDLVSSCLIGSEGGGTGINPNSILISYGGLVVCCSNTVFKLTIPGLRLGWKTKADMATCFEIYELDKDYVVHGEMEITRLDKNGQIVWQQGGRDIWTTAEGIDDFVVYDNYILATDWDFNRYKFDFDGKLLEDYKIEPKNVLSANEKGQTKKWWSFWN